MPVSDGPPLAAAEVVDLTVDYVTASGPVRALDEVSARFEDGALTVVAGPSGSGKSSLLWALAGLQTHRAGSITVAGTDIGGMRARARRRFRRRRIGVVLQDPADNLLDYLTALEQVALAARLRGGDPADARPLLESLGLGDRLGSWPEHLSGGEQQRVAFAAGAVGRPTVLLADEPTAELDGEAGAALIESMRVLVDRGTSLIVSSHDAAVIAAADTVVTLRDGRAVG